MTKISTLWVDPSYTGTGLCYVEGKQVILGLVSSPGTKRSLEMYWKAAYQLQKDLKRWVSEHSCQHYNVYMEAPVPMGMSSPGLYALQFLYLHNFACDALFENLYSISPSWIRSCLRTKFHVEVSGRSKGERKEFCALEASLAKQEGYTIFNEELFKHRDDDVATAFLFWRLTEKLNKQWPLLEVRNG